MYFTASGMGGQIGAGLNHLGWMLFSKAFQLLSLTGFFKTETFSVCHCLGLQTSPDRTLFHPSAVRISRDLAYSMAL